MPDLEPIASPPSVRWREFRQGRMPYAVFALVCVAAVLLWRESSGRTAFVGQAESVHATLVATRPGTLATLNVDLLDHVKQGDVLAQMLPADLTAVQAKLAAGLELLRAQLLQSTERNTVNYQQLRLDWLRGNVELATARIELQLSETDLARYTALRQGAIISDADFEARQAHRDTFRDKVVALARLTSDLEAQLSSLQSAQKSAESPVDRAINAAALAQREELAALAASAQLRAPIDGVVTVVHLRPGEHAAAGAPVLTLGALRPTRIIAYQRQPIDVRFYAGDTLEVGMRGATRGSARARIIRVGSQLEAIAPALLPAVAVGPHLTEYGLPFLIEIPPALALAPAEIVTLTVESK